MINVGKIKKNGQISAHKPKCTAIEVLFKETYIFKWFRDIVSLNLQPFENLSIFFFLPPFKDSTFAHAQYF